MFKYGKGRVMHSLSHVYPEAGTVAGAVAAQRLALNFVLMSLLDPAQRPPDAL